MLSLVGVTKQYLYGKRLFGALDLRVENGETLAILGQGKDGKTSLLKAIAGIDEYEGQILLDGVKIKLKTDDIIFVFDDGALFKRKTARYNLAYPLTLRGVKKEDTGDYIVPAVAELGIAGLLDEKVKNLSLYEQKLLSLARVLMRPSKLVLIDDITKGLERADADLLFNQVLSVVSKLKSNGTTVLYSTSSNEEAIAIADRIMVLHDGDVKQIGTAQDIYNNPQSICSAIWSAQAIDKHYNVLKGNIDITTGEFSTKINEKVFKFVLFSKMDKIVPRYDNCEILIGWHIEDTLSYGITDNVKNRFHTIDGDIVETENGIFAKTKSTDSKIEFQPVLDKVTAFDASTENSIMVGK
ncbi:MAG: ATP-binding cassette domain-containing protein [Clostridia bacterium]|nr:ATP-binding cassette domain-containing protein [Clostridia bacterium]